MLELQSCQALHSSPLASTATLLVRKTGGQRAIQNRNFSACAIFIAFLLGMMVATTSLLTVQHYGLGDASFTKSFFSTTVSRVQPIRARPVPVYMAGRFTGKRTAKLGTGKREKRKQRALNREVSASTAATGAAVIPLPVIPEDDVAARVRQMTRLNQPRKLIQLFNETVEARKAEVLPLVMRGLIKMQAIERAIQLQRQHVPDSALPLDTQSATTLFLGLCGTRRLDAATTMLSDLQKAYPPPPEAEAVKIKAAWEDVDASDPERLAKEPMWHSVGSVMLPALAVAHAETGGENLGVALALMESIVQQPTVALPPESTLTKLIIRFARARCFKGIFACLDVQALARREDGPEWQQAIGDAVARSVRFVKGGVSMGTLPGEPYPEVAFIGRSNVGKSSLTNYLIGRRKMAYVSKTPGKTQQYNYFIINEPQKQKRHYRSQKPADDSAEAWRQLGTFHLVDMPGLGFAKVPGVDRKRWLRFLGKYARERPQLKMIVHLIDGQVGPQETDLMIMQMIKEAAENDTGAAIALQEQARSKDEDATSAHGAASLAEKSPLKLPVGGVGGWRYAIVLTKVDKGSLQRAKRVEARVRKALEETGCPMPQNIVITSSSQRVGRGDMWRMLRRLVLNH